VADPPHPLGLREGPRQPTAGDRDGDGLDDQQEALLKTNLDSADTDGDGLSDWVESVRGTNPRRFTDDVSDKTTDLEDVAAEMRQQRGGRGPGEIMTGEAGRHAFLDAAKAQIGDPYRFGAEARLDDADPDAFDSSELVEWAAAQAGIKLPDGSWRQYQHLHAGGNAVSVEDALRTPGALVFGFSSDPLASSQRPARSFVAISLGNGRVLDVSERAGEVREMEAGEMFTHAAVIPEIVNDLDSDGDGYSDELERDYDLDPFDKEQNLDPRPAAPTAPTPPSADATESTDATMASADAADATSAGALSQEDTATSADVAMSEDAATDEADLTASEASGQEDASTSEAVAPADVAIYPDAAIYEDTSSYEDTTSYDDTSGYDASSYEEAGDYDDVASLADIG
jgi:hypothetical protein